ncbi:hypothetical protein HXZ94_09850 [Empedobacter falsenii]|uniref:hypothetical protein n=1 Tax=Empedobacter falsenii TaxID=343874 RepID=UPI00257559F5|nr:hypothetical protein [Empedobacter falsenii]MDM1298802.1 hypothetical protein [Empedobacter falsenii]MDM1318588.1 hypothetical protein [Empedobacter falsenii]
MKKIYLFFVFVLSIFSTKAFAADFYWTGKATTNNYNSLQNWALGSVNGGIPTVVPGASDNVFFTDGATKFNVDFSQSNIVFNNFTSNSTTNDFAFRLTAPGGSAKTLTVNGVMNLSSRASFSSSSSGDISYVGSLILKNNPILNNNELAVYLVFNSGTNIVIANNFNAMSIVVDNGTTLDLSNRTVYLKKYTNLDNDAGMFKIMNSASGIKLNTAIIHTETTWFLDFNLSKSDFSNSTLYIHGGTSQTNNLSHNTSSGNLYKGLTVEKAGVVLPKVIIDNANNYTGRTCTIINNNSLSITDLTVKNTNIYFDTANLSISNLTIDKGYDYRFYGTSTQTTPSANPNLTVTNFNFNPLSSGTTKFKSYLSKYNTLAYLDLPTVSTPAYSNMVANGIYSKNVVTFANSVLENLNKNINVTSGVAVDYYWGGKGDGKTWTDLANWSSSGSVQSPVATLPTSNDNIFFNTNSIISGRIDIDKVIDIHNFTVLPDFIGKNFEIFSLTNNSFTIRGSLELQKGATLSIQNLFFVPKSSNLNSPETITLNEGVLKGSIIEGNKLVVTGGGALSLEGSNFSYYNESDLARNAFVLENGSLIFNASTINLNEFTGVVEKDSSFKTNLYLKNSIINTKFWTYNNINNTNLNNQFTLDGGTSTINVYLIFNAAGDAGAYTIDNKLKYNKIVLKNSNSAIRQMLYGIFDAAYLELEPNTYLGVPGAGIFSTVTNQINVNELKVYAGNLLNFDTNYRINIIDKYQTISTGTCQLVTILDGQTNTVNFNLSSTVTDTSNTPNVLTLNSYDIKNIKFGRSASYVINISGSADALTSGYTKLVSAIPVDLYWIGSNSSTNLWHNSINWTTNANGTANASSCSPTKFDNAHFKSYSNAKGNEVAINNDIYINNIIFENDSPTGMSLKGNGSKDIYLSGSMYLNNNTITGLNRLLTSGKQTDATYDGTARHKIQLRGTDLKMRINVQDGSYYKLVDDFKNTNSDIYMTGTSDIDASNITMNLANFTAANVTPIASGKLNINNSKVNLSGNFSSQSPSFSIMADNAIIKLNLSSTFSYFNPTNSTTAFNTAMLEFIDARASTNTILGPATADLLFKSITTRGVTFNVNSSITTEVLNSLSNKISIAAGKELKVTQQANLSGTACDVTRSIVSSVAGTRAKFTITGGPTNFDYLTVKDIDANSSYQILVFGTYSTNGGNNTSYVTFLDKTQDDSTYGFGAVSACRDLTTSSFLSADGFYPNAFTTYKWYKLTGDNADPSIPIATTRNIDLSLYGYGTYKLEINYDPTTAGSCVITDQIIINPTPTKPTELSDDKFCKNKVVTLGDIQLPGSTLVWYNSDSATTPLPLTTIVSSGTTYYVARKYDSGSGMACESTDRLALQVKLDACGGVYLNPVLRMRGL